MSENIKTILIVDDEEDLRELLVYEAESWDYNVIEASSGNKAFEIYKEGRTNLILSDVNMPDGNGLDLTENVKKMDPSFPVILVVSDPTQLGTAKEKGADLIIDKPFKFDALKESIKVLLNK